MLSDFLNLLFPLNCINCHKVLIKGEQLLCISCKSDLPYTDDFNHPSNELFQKLSYINNLSSASSLLYFTKNNITQKLLYQLKYQGKEEIGSFLGELIGRRISNSNLMVDAIIPVPLFKKRQQERGYNQSLKIAEGIADVTGLDIDSLSVIRKRSTTSQTRKSKVDRWKDVDRVYECVESLEGKSILLVDDVITTGATIGILAEELARAGVLKLHIVSAARPR